MLEYLPWSEIVLEEAIRSYKNNDFSILDLELGGCCNLKCVYCDSPDRSKKFVLTNELKNIISLDKIKWVFICGLGEPTFGDNKENLYQILELCSAKGIKCSMFTNLLDFDEGLFDYVDREILYVMFKFDSFDEEKIRFLYGNPLIQIKELTKKIDRLISLSKVRDNCTNLCASIVPTTLNFDELGELISFCICNDIYPLIGDLENSGRGQEIYDRLKLNDEQLKYVKSLLPQNYNIPICPSVICGIHVLYDNIVALDERTGLSCHWFWLAEPCIHRMNNLSAYSSFEEIEMSVIQYRNKKMPYIQEIANKLDNLVFGGCGGDIKTLLKKYIEINTSGQ